MEIKVIFDNDSQFKDAIKKELIDIKDAYSYEDIKEYLEKTIKEYVE